MKYKIAYIDEDEATISQFYHTFHNDFEILPIPVNTKSSVESIIRELFSSNLDLIVTDYLLEDKGEVSFNGNRIVEAVREIRPHFPLIMITSHQTEAISHTDDVHIIYSKDIMDGEHHEELEVFKAKVNSSIANYYKKINDTNAKIEQLIIRRNSKGLQINEEEELSKLFMLYDELKPEEKDIPANIIRWDSISKLNEFVSETREVLEQLKKLNQKK